MKRTASAVKINAYFDFIGNKGFPCIAAKAALAKDQISCLVADDLADSGQDAQILTFLYDFVDQCRKKETAYSTAVVIFSGPMACSEKEFDSLFWQRLQALANLDALQYLYDHRVDNDPASVNFSFSLKSEAFYIIGLHANSSRKARQFQYPSIVFNPHSQFEGLRETNKFEPMRKAVRQRDIIFSGSVNPMLKDFGQSSEVFQYTGLQYDENWKCPFESHHGKTEHNPST